MSVTSIIERMDAGLAVLHQRTGARALPKAFYLGPEDWSDFIATNPPTGRFRRGNNPTVWADEPKHRDLPVRASKNVPPRQSRLYNQTGSGRAI